MSLLTPRFRSHRTVVAQSAPRRMVPGFWSAVSTREALSLDHRRRIADAQGAADIVTANGMVLCLR